MHKDMVQINLYFHIINNFQIQKEESKWNERAMEVLDNKQDDFPNLEDETASDAQVT